MLLTVLRETSRNMSIRLARLRGSCGAGKRLHGGRSWSAATICSLTPPKSVIFSFSPTQSFQKGELSMVSNMKRFKSTNAATSTQPPLILSYKRGKYKLNLPLKGGGDVAAAERDTTFSFRPDHRLDIVKANIREEGVSTVEFVGPDGQPLPDESTVGDAAWHGGFEMNLDGKQFPVLATRSGGYIDDDKDGGGRTELPSLLERGRVLRLRAALADDTRRSMTYTEFENICEDCGMDEADARKVAADLHKVGVILHFHKEPGLTDIVYLQPHQVLEHFFAKYDLESPLRQYLLKQAEQLSKEKGVLGRELTPTLKLKEAIDGQARKTASRCMWALSGAVVAGAGGYWYLSYVYLSWDIMEPVTFFTALGISTLSYAWWMFTNKEYQYSNIFDFFFNKMIQGKYKAGGLDLNLLAETQEKFRVLENKEKLLSGKIFELECMREKGLTAAEAAGMGKGVPLSNGIAPSIVKYN